MSKYLLTNATYLAGDDMILTNGDLLIEQDRITMMGQIPSEARRGAVLVDAGAHLVLPGFVNTHTHVAMTLLRGYAGDMALEPWLNDYIWPAEAKLTDEDVYWGSQLGLLEMIAGGTTCLADMYDHMDAVAQAVADSGLRANLCRGMIGMADPEYKSLAENDALYDRWHGAENDRIRVYYGPHAPNTCGPEYLQEAAARAKARQTGIHIHVSETKHEVEAIQAQYGRSPVAHLADLGVFDQPTLAAHCVCVDATDIDLLAQHNVAVAHNPVSNMKLASGMAPITEMRAKGMVVALGTDGASSNNALSIMRELQTAALIHKVRTMDPLAIHAKEALQMATIEGAKALAWQNDIGSLDIGKKADLIMLRIDKPWFAPGNDTLAHVAYSAHIDDIECVMVDGRMVYEAGRFLTLDAEKIMAEATTRAKRILNK